MENKLQSTDKTNQQLKVIQQVGSLSEISFAKKVLDFNPIKYLSNEELGFMLGIVFVRVANLLGLKDPVSDINKQDIKEMILMRFKNISVEEISYAFKLERFGLLGDKTQHFQLFNAEYVSEVLGKYKKWLQRTRQQNNLPMVKIEEKTTISEEEKENIIIHGLITCFDEYQQKGKLDPNQITEHYHDYLHEKEMFDFSEEERKIMWKASKQKVFDKLQLIGDISEWKKTKSEIEKGDTTWRHIEYKKIRLSRYFDGLLAKGKHLKDFI